MRLFRLCTLLVLTLLIWGTVAVQALADNAEDSITSWRLWKSIDAAIVLHPLDGPDDILEKAEIIEDRVDELEREKLRLEKDIDDNHLKIQSLINQREVLQDLSDIKMGGDSQSQQRLRDLAERIRREERLQKIRQESINGLEIELIQMKALLAEYNEKARVMRIREGGVR